MGRAFADRSFLGGLWLNMLPAILFGMLVVLVPLQLDEGGFTPLAIGAVFLLAGLLETVVNPFLGPLLGSTRPPPADPRRACGLRSPSRSPSQSRATRTRSRSSPSSPRSRSGPSTRLGWRSSPTALSSSGSRRRIGFGIMNTAWALGNMTGPALAGTIADAAGDGLPYVLAAVLCALTLAATSRLSSRAGTVRAPT